MVLVVLPYLLFGAAIAWGWHGVDLHRRPARVVAAKYCLTALAWPIFLAGTIALAVLASRIDPHRQRRRPDPAVSGGLALTMPPSSGAREAIDA